MSSVQKYSLLISSLTKHFGQILLWIKLCPHTPHLLWAGVSTLTGEIKSFEDKQASVYWLLNQFTLG